MSQMKLLSSFQLETRFYSNGKSIKFLYLLRDDMSALWLNQDPIWKKNGNNNEISNGVSVLPVVYQLKEQLNNRKRTLVVIG